MCIREVHFMYMYLVAVLTKEYYSLKKKRVNFHSIFTFLGVTSVITCLGVKID